MNEPQSALLAAATLAEAERWQQALDALGPALASQDTGYEAYCLRAECLMAQGSLHIDQARKSVESALAIDPHRPQAHFGMASILRREKRFAAALREAEEGMRLDPGGVPGLSVWDLRLVARCQVSAYRIEDAARTAQAAVAADSQDPVGYLTVADVALADSDYGKAERAYRDGLSLDPDNVDLLLGLADLLRTRGRGFESVETYLAAAAAAGSRGEIVSKGLRDVWLHLCQAEEDWRKRSFDKVGSLVSGPFTPSIGQAWQEFSEVSSGLRLGIAISLKQAMDLLNAAVTGSGAEALRRTAAPPAEARPDEGTHARSPRPPGAGEIPKLKLPPGGWDWSVLGMEEDPVHDQRTDFYTAAAELASEAMRVAKRGEQSSALAAAGKELRIVDTGPDFRQIMAGVRAQTVRLGAAYQACSTALSGFKNRLDRAHRQTSGARAWAGTAVTQRDLALKMGLGPKAEEWEDERQGAIYAAKAAVETRNQAEAECAEAIRSAIRELSRHSD